jgi:hypothetical protein
MAVKGNFEPGDDTSNQRLSLPSWADLLASDA